jgi:hypothetical protein
LEVSEASMGSMREAPTLLLKFCCLCSLPSATHIHPLAHHPLSQQGRRQARSSKAGPQPCLQPVSSLCLVFSSIFSPVDCLPPVRYQSQLVPSATQHWQVWYVLGRADDRRHRQQHTPDARSSKCSHRAPPRGKGQRARPQGTCLPPPLAPPDPV